MFKQIEKEAFYYGFPVILMTTKDPLTGADCLTPITSTWTLDKSVVLGIGLNNKGYLNLAEGSPVTLNLAEAALWQKVEAIAKLTGNEQVPAYKVAAGYDYCPDKFAVGGFKKIPGSMVPTVRIAECPIQLETRVVNITERQGFAIVVCEISSVFVEEGLLSDDTHIAVNRWQPLIYKFREYTTTSDALGKNFRFQESSD